ncbi:hypothetical protein KIW84_031498 [Lathyrus oleraceus]|uniref:PB1-like domain-containing protein n=1 Tax=Pisum sativum TaxID=3888 RepID=A0A9D4XVY6_PEA|nr:hypothetical protein KIW84_031498 [Pisum sativum]
MASKAKSTKATKESLLLANMLPSVTSIAKQEYVMSDMFECVIHHEGMFVEFNILGYDGLEEVWQVDPDFWSYFEVLGGLKDLGYSKVESLWYYDAMDDNELVLLKDDT